MKRIDIEFKGTKYKSYLLDAYEHYRNLFEMAIDAINQGLVEYSNFDGVDFCDVNANGIQIRGHHKEIDKYTYGKQPTIKSDLSNIMSASKEFIDMWKTMDTPEQVRSFKDFLEMGEKYGWN